METVEEKAKVEVKVQVVVVVRDQNNSSPSSSCHHQGHSLCWPSRSCRCTNHSKNNALAKAKLTVL